MLAVFIALVVMVVVSWPEDVLVVSWCRLCWWWCSVGAGRVGCVGLVIYLQYN